MSARQMLRPASTRINLLLPRAVQPVRHPAASDEPMRRSNPAHARQRRYFGRSASRRRGSWARKYVSIKAKGRKPTGRVDRGAGIRYARRLLDPPKVPYGGFSLIRQRTVPSYRAPRYPEMVNSGVNQTVDHVGFWRRGCGPSVGATTAEIEGATDQDPRQAYSMLMFLNGRNTALAVAVASRVPSGSRKRPSRWAVVCPMRSTSPRAMTRATGVGSR